MYFSRACIVSRRWNARRSRRSTSFSTKIHELWLFFSLRSTTIFAIEGILFSFSLSLASSWRSFRPAIEKSREIGNVSDPVYGLSLQRFAIECRLYIVLLYVYYLYMYIYILVYIKSLWTVSLIKISMTLVHYILLSPLFFFVNTYTYMYVFISFVIFGWHHDCVYAKLSPPLSSFSCFFFTLLISIPPELLVTEWNKTWSWLGCVNGYTRGYSSSSMVSRVND